MHINDDTNLCIGVRICSCLCSAYRAEIIMDQRNAKLRVCASCEWIFETSEETENSGCPKCHFGHYGARFVYGNPAYRYAITQKPWFDKKMADYAFELQKQINADAPLIKTRLV